MDRSSKRKVNMNRSWKIIRTAAKQCDRNRFPYLDEPVLLSDWSSWRKQTICLDINGDLTLSDWIANHQLDQI